MQADAQAGGKLGIIVDDQLRAVTIAQLAQGLGLAQTPSVVLGLVAVLEQPSTAFQRRLGVGQQSPESLLSVMA